MANVKRTCRVCGKQYTFCRTLVPTDGTFRWQDVACSPECGAKYLEQIFGASKEKTVERKSSKKSRCVSQEKPIEAVNSLETDSVAENVEPEEVEYIEP